jgi:transposase
MSAFEAGLGAGAYESHPGRPPIDRRILVALWVYGTSEGVSETQKLDRLCRLHMAYLWICGGVSVDYHLLSDFRVQHEEALNKLMNQVLAGLAQRGQVQMHRTAQDGMRVRARASAGAASFHREGTLRKALDQAQQEPVEPTQPRGQPQHEHHEEEVG